MKKPDYNWWVENAHTDSSLLLLMSAVIGSVVALVAEHGPGSGDECRRATSASM
jgi:hypothetical protein